MAKKRQRALERLSKSLEEQDLVRIERDILFDSLEGYVLDIGAEWFIVALLDPDIVLDGYAFLRLADVRRVRGRNNAEMVQRALTVREQWPPTPPGEPYDLSNVVALLNSLQGAPVVTLHPEDNDPDVMFVGAPAGVSERTARLLEISPRAVWLADVTKHRLDAITRTEIGGRYEQALLSVAGERPTVPDGG